VTHYEWMKSEVQRKTVNAGSLHVAMVVSSCLRAVKPIPSCFCCCFLLYLELLQENRICWTLALDELNGWMDGWMDKSLVPLISSLNGHPVWTVSALLTCHTDSSLQACNYRLGTYVCALIHSVAKNVSVLFLE